MIEWHYMTSCASKVQFPTYKNLNTDTCFWGTVIEPSVHGAVVGISITPVLWIWQSAPTVMRVGGGGGGGGLPYAVCGLPTVRHND